MCRTWPPQASREASRARRCCLLVHCRAPPLEIAATIVCTVCTGCALCVPACALCVHGGHWVRAACVPGVHCVCTVRARKLCVHRWAPCALCAHCVLRTVSTACALCMHRVLCRWLQQERPDEYKTMLEARAEQSVTGVPLLLWQPLERCIEHFCSILVVTAQHGEGDCIELTEKQVAAFMGEPSER